MVTRIAVLAVLCLAVAPATAAPIRLVSEDAGGVVVEMATERPKLVDVTRDGKRYVEVVGGEWDETSAVPGAPLVPSARVHLLVPAGATVLVETLETAAPVALPLAHDVAFVERLPIHDGKRHVVRRDDAAYRLVYGERLAAVEELGWAGRERIAAVRLSPLRYDAAARRLHWTPSFRMRFRFEGADESARAAGIDGIARYFVLNRGSLATRSRAARIDLLIAHTSHKEAVQRLVQFKKMSGRVVREHYVNGKTKEEIQQLIRAEYARSEPPTHTIFVGNIDQIPAWSGTGDNKKTDFPYQKLDGNDDLPDLSLGRIPAHNAQELGAFIDKDVAREIDPRNVTDVLLTAGRDTSFGCPANVTKVGDKMKVGGGDIKLTQKYKTQVSTQAVIDAYNDEPNLVVYDGHGDRQGMQEIPLLINDLDKLTNKTFPIILDIACLNANWGSGASPRNFAESILLKPGKGAAGIMASGGSGNGHEFFQSIGRIMGEARQHLASDTKMNEIGQVILAAKILHGSQDRSYWNYYGDPASSVWETTGGALRVR